MISLITATLGRIDTIVVLLDSLANQTYKDFEIIIVDQNEHDKVKKIIEKYNGVLDIKYIKNSQKGLSLNRNLGLDIAKSNIIGFPDDDCYYSSDVLENVINVFENNTNISFCATDWYDSSNMGAPARCFNESKITKKEVYNKCISFNIFVLNKWGIKFDEKLGVGADFGAGEETDYLYSLISKSGLNGYFFKSGGVYHPIEKDRKLSKTYSYAVGQGAVWKKDLVKRHNFGVIREFCLTSIRYILIGIKHLDFKLTNAMISGFIKGLKNYSL